MGGTRRLRVAIIGAGMSGLCMAVKLQDAGFGDYTIFEAADDVGGTWRDNTYPGLTCDVPSRYYAYTFLPNPDWTRMLSPGSEIQRYLQRVADERSIRSRIRFGSEVTAACYRGGRWWLTTHAGEEAFDVLIAATGVLRIPRLPDIPGLATFAGPMFHSSRWDHSVRLHDKRIGLIGTGSTGVQITSELAGNCRDLTLFQRTAQWIYPWPNPRVRWLTRAALRRWPTLNAVLYGVWGYLFTHLFGTAVIRPGWQRSLVQAQCRWYLRWSVRDRELRRKLTPDFAPMCKRMVFASRFYRAVRRPGVTVVTDAIDHVEPRGVVTADGVLHEFDLLVLATGFDARAYARPMQIVGETAISLDEAWSNGPQAYQSVAVPGFPNMFMLMGPHSPVGNNSLVPIAEDQADYVVGWLERLRDDGVLAVAPTEAATKDYNERMKAAMPQTVWTAGCRSWYLGPDALPELFPWAPWEYRLLMRRHSVADFHVTSAEM